MDNFLNIKNVLLLIFLITTFFMTIIPIIRPLRDERGTGRLNRYGIIFIILAGTSFALGTAKTYLSHLDARRASEDVKKILNKIQDESLRLQNTDFQMLLISTCFITNLNQEIPQIKPVFAKGRIGNAEIFIELKEVGDRCTTFGEFWTFDARAYGRPNIGPGV